MGSRFWYANKLIAQILHSDPTSGTSDPPALTALWQLLQSLWQRAGVDPPGSIQAGQLVEEVGRGVVWYAVMGAGGWADVWGKGEISGSCHQILVLFSDPILWPRSMQTCSSQFASAQPSMCCRAYPQYRNTFPLPRELTGGGAGRIVSGGHFFLCVISERDKDSCELEILKGGRGYLIQGKLQWRTTRRRRRRRSSWQLQICWEHTCSWYYLQACIT